MTAPSAWTPNTPPLTRDDFRRAGLAAVRAQERRDTEYATAMAPVFDAMASAIRREDTMTHTPHTLNVTVDEMGVHEYRIDCPDGRLECNSYAACEAVACDRAALDSRTRVGAAVLHGAMHHFIDGEWVVPVDACFIQDHPDLVAAARRLNLPHSGGELAAGSYTVTLAPQADPTVLALRVVRDRVPA